MGAYGGLTGLCRIVASSFRCCHASAVAVLDRHIDLNPSRVPGGVVMAGGYALGVLGPPNSFGTVTFEASGKHVAADIGSAHFSSMLL